MEVSADKDMGCSAMCGKSKAVLAMRKELNTAFHIPRPEGNAVATVLQSTHKSAHRASPSTSLSPALEGAVGAREENAGVTEANRL